jgi:hypoxanthine phosphoribosyltransferase
MNEQPAVLFPAEQIQARVRQLGTEIASTLAGEEICVVGLMKSCLVFMADLIRVIPLPQTCHFLQSSSLRELGSATARTDIVYSADIPYAGRHILLLDDIIDTGITLSFLLDHIREHDPASLHVCALLDKPGERKIDVRPDWTAFTLEEPVDRFIVGYGLDYRESYRELPYLATISVRPPSAEGRRITLVKGGPRDGQEEAS